VSKLFISSTKSFLGVNIYEDEDASSKHFSKLLSVCNSPYNEAAASRNVDDTIPQTFFKSSNDDGPLI
jgi:hypothetical protein